ncbi:unnamed protein product, partial [Mesorhabditis spiculigera]
MNPFFLVTYIYLVVVNMINAGPINASPRYVCFITKPPDYGCMESEWQPEAAAILFIHESTIYGPLDAWGSSNEPNILAQIQVPYLDLMAARQSGKNPGDASSVPTPTTGPESPGDAASAPSPTTGAESPGDASSVPTPTTGPESPGDAASAPSPTTGAESPGDASSVLATSTEGPKMPEVEPTPDVVQSGAHRPAGPLMLAIVALTYVLRGL